MATRSASVPGTVKGRCVARGVARNISGELVRSDSRELRVGDGIRCNLNVEVEVLLRTGGGNQRDLWAMHRFLGRNFDGIGNKEAGQQHNKSKLSLHYRSIFAQQTNTCCTTKIDYC